MDEKSPLLRPLLRRNSGNPRWEVFLALIAAAFFISLGLTIHKAPNGGQGTYDVGPDTEASAFSWAKIPPSRTLEWHPCFGPGYDCARLDVPMDWLDPSGEERVILAIARLRAASNGDNSTDAADYRGPVFFNPGGPGGSGIWALRDHGPQLQAVVGRNHDLVALDPRGVGASVPRIECWDSTQQRHDWAMQETPVIDAHPGVLYDAWARAAGFSAACARSRSHRASGLLAHIGTASHARDMLAVLEGMAGAGARLRYWGFSYGTVLGGTFAAMYPDRVERMVSDGNVDYEEWYRSTHVNSVRDADAILEAFYELCHKAGPEKCAFYSPSPADIKARHLAILERLRSQPVMYMPDRAAGSALPELVTYSKIRRLTATSLYRPNYYFTHLAEVLAGLEKGDGAPYYALVTRSGLPFSDVCTVEPVPPTEPLTTEEEGSDDAFPVILCADHKPLTQDPREFEDRVREMESLSEVSGAIVIKDLVACAGHAVRPKWAFDGPFDDVKTSFPVLYIANMADNITPLASARNNSAGFEGSVVLIQNSYGVSSRPAGYLPNQH